MAASHLNKPTDLARPSDPMKRANPSNHADPLRREKPAPGRQWIREKGDFIARAPHSKTPRPGAPCHGLIEDGSRNFVLDFPLPNLGPPGKGLGESSPMDEALELETLASRGNEALTRLMRLGVETRQPGAES